MKFLNSAKRFCALLLAAALLLPCLSVSAAEAGEGTLLAPGLTLHESQYYNESGGKVEEKYLVYSPGAGSLPAVAYGRTLYGMSTIQYVADYLTGEGNAVASGINGDFYMTDTGIPIGMVVTDGILRTSDAGAAAIGFREDGSAFIGYPNLKVTAVTDSGALVQLNYVNKTRKNYGVYLLTPDFSATTRTTGESVIVVLSELSGELKVGSFVNAKVTEVLTTDEMRPIGQNEMLITATVENGNSQRIEGFQVGDNVQIQVQPAEDRWTEAVSAVGVGDLLVQDGAVLPDLSSARHPRTAIGVRADGSVIAYVADGRNSAWSVGMGLAELAQRMLALGCVSAANLDGGGSTAMIAALPGRSDFTTQNRPSEGKLRVGANGIFFLNPTPVLGVPTSFHFYPASVTLLAGTSYTATPYAADANLHPAEVPTESIWTVNGLGSISPTGTYTAPVDYTGTDTVFLGWEGVYGSYQVNVLASPDRIILSKDGAAVNSLHLEPSQSINLTAACEVAGAPIASAPELYRWSVTGDVGTYKNGVFTATSENGVRGSLTVSYGETSASVQIVVGKGTTLLASFEGEDTGLTPLSAGISAAIQTERTNVRFGEASAKIVTSFAEGAEKLSLAANWKVPMGSLQLRAWVSGDNSQNELWFSFLHWDGSIREVPVCLLDYKGYRQQTVTIPDGAISLAAISVLRRQGGRATGTIYLDQIVASFETAEDTVPPTIQLSLDSASTPGSLLLNARLSDNLSAIDPASLVLRMDGERMGYSYTPETGTLIATLLDPADGGLHRITLEASDASGNLARSTWRYDLRGEQEESPFADAPGSSAETEANYLYRRDVLHGAKDADGLLKYFPERTMTRAEFAVLMAGYLGVDPADYAAVELPFEDSDAIDWWARDAVAAMYALGVVNGKLRNDGTIIYDGRATITRADVATVLGRTLPGGFRGAALRYQDADRIPGYAAEHIAVLATLGAVEQGETFRPAEPATRGEVVRMIYGLY